MKQDVNKQNTGVTMRGRGAQERQNKTRVRKGGGLWEQGEEERKEAAT